MVRAGGATEETQRSADQPHDAFAKGTALSLIGTTCACVSTFGRCAGGRARSGAGYSEVFERCLLRHVCICAQSGRERGITGVTRAGKNDDLEVLQRLLLEKPEDVGSSLLTNYAAGLATGMRRRSRDSDDHRLNARNAPTDEARPPLESPIRAGAPSRRTRFHPPAE